MFFILYANNKNGAKFEQWFNNMDSLRKKRTQLMQDGWNTWYEYDSRGMFN